MADEIGKLLKNEDSSSQIKPAASQKKLRESKKRLNGICRSLLIDTEAYEPKRTANSVDAYIASTEKVDRILYSVISGFIVGLDEKSRDINDKVVCDKNGKKKWNKKRKHRCTNSCKRLNRKEKMRIKAFAIDLWKT